MAYGFEVEIHNLLKESDNTIKVADEVLKKWDRGELSWKDQEVAAEFLLNAGFLPALFEQISKTLKARQKIPWAVLFEGFARTRTRLTKEEIDQILVGAGEEDALAEICRSRALDAVDPRFSKIRANVRIERRARAQKPAVRQQTMIDDRTRPMVENIKARKVTLAEWAKRAEELAPETKEKFARIAASMIGHARGEPSTAYDIAISLRFMGLPNEALDALKFARPQTAASLWLELDLLLETQRHVEVLEQADRLEKKFSSDPDASFSAAYARAIAFHSLGEHARATTLLEGIVKVRPTYRSAHSMLLKWKDEEK